jgi:hypothetical protein
MDVVYERCCGLDVHKRSVTACLILSGPGGPPDKQRRTFGTMTDDILRLAAWLAAAGCTHVALESTGSYWKPLWNLLQGPFTLLLVNARHSKALPGRKTDVGLRHEVVSVAVEPERSGLNLVFCHQYPTVACG